MTPIGWTQLAAKGEENPWIQAMWVSFLGTDCGERVGNQVYPAHLPFQKSFKFFFPVFWLSYVICSLMNSFIMGRNDQKGNPLIMKRKVCESYLKGIKWAELTSVEDNTQVHGTLRKDRQYGARSWWNCELIYFLLTLEVWWTINKRKNGDNLRFHTKLTMCSWLFTQRTGH